MLIVKREVFFDKLLQFFRICFEAKLQFLGF